MDAIDVGGGVEPREARELDVSLMEQFSTGFLILDHLFESSAPV